MSRSFYWVGYIDGKTEKLDYPAGAVEVSNQWMLQIRLKNPLVVSVFGPYAAEDLPTSIADCASDKKMKG